MQRSSDLGRCALISKLSPRAGLGSKLRQRYTTGGDSVHATSRVSSIIRPERANFKHRVMSKIKMKNESLQEINPRKKNRKGLWGSSMTYPWGGSHKMYTPLPSKPSQRTSSSNRTCGFTCQCLSRKQIRPPFI